MCQYGGGNLTAAQHARKLSSAIIFLEIGDLGDCATILDGFFDSKVVVREAGDLGQMSNAKHLANLAQLPQLAPNGFGSSAPNARIHLVEDQGLIREMPS